MEKPTQANLDDWYRRVREYLGTPEDIRRRSERMDRDHRFLLAHKEEWREENPNTWVAVYNGELIAMERSWKRMEKVLQRRPVPEGNPMVCFLGEKKPNYL
jgi:hypothetical protein